MPIRNRSAYAFLAPYLLVFAAFWVWPIINSFLISFQNTRINPWKFSLQANWGRLFADPAAVQLHSRNDGQTPSNY